MIVKNTSNTLECVFINRRGYDFSPANLTKDNCYFYLHGADYAYSHKLNGKVVDNMPF
jgi:hypothetical protein